MDVRCQKCGTEYEFDGTRIGAQGVTVKCTACGFVFKVRRESEPVATGSTDWLVKKADNKLIAFKELTTLQKWIVEGRIERDDEISKNGETWKRLGNVGELEAFFAVYEKARALNDLMTTGAIGERPILVNGSEVLATMNPLSSGLSSGAPAHHGLPEGHIPTNPIAPAARRLSSGVAIGARPALPPPPSPLPDELSDDLLLGSEAPTKALARLESTAKPSNGASGHPAPTPADASVSAPPTGYAGPAALEIPPLATERPASSDGLQGSSWPRPSVPPDEIVDRFERRQRRSRALIALLAIIIGGLVGGALFALLGPTDNPLRISLIQYGLINDASPPTTDEATPHIAEARRAADLDSIVDLRRADAEYRRALELRPGDPDLLAERSLVLTTLADTLRRQALDDELIAREAENALREWQAATARHAALPTRGRGPPPAAPEAVDVEAIRKSFGDQRDEASELMKSAFEYTRQAYERAPSSAAANRALAGYYRVQRDMARMTPVLEKAQAVSDGRDAATLHIEAAAMVPEPEGAEPAKLEAASRLLEHALTVHPAMLRARVLLARILIAKGLDDLATSALDQVLAACPRHEAAARLKLKLEANAAPPPADVPEPEPTAVASKPSPAPAKKAPEPAPKAKPQPKPSEPTAEADAPAAPKTFGFDYWMRQGKRLRDKGDPWKALHAYEKATVKRPMVRPPRKKSSWFLVRPMATRPTPMGKSRVSTNTVKASGSPSLS